MMQIPVYWCRMDNLGVNATAALKSMSASEKLNLISPVIMNGDGISSRDSCRIKDTNFTTLILQNSRNLFNFTDTPNDYIENGSNTNDKPCEKWDFDETYSGHTLVSQWDLICERTWLRGVVKSIHMIGQFFGVAIGGVLSDRFGRQPIGRASVISSLILRLIMAFNPIFEIYLLIRLLTGALDLLIYTSFYVLCAELISPGERAFVVAAISLGFNLGIMISPLVGWMLPNWVHICLANTFIGAILCLSTFFIPESPRWLFCVGRVKEAQLVLKRMAKINLRKIPSDFSCVLDTGIEEQQGPGQLHYLKSKLVLCRLAVTTYLWFCISMIFYAITFNVGSFVGNIYLNLFILGVTGLPVILISILMSNSCIGRRLSLSLGLLISSVCLFSDIACARDSIVRTILATVGKQAAHLGFICVYMITAEVFPTGMRSMAIGLASAGARLGALLCPFLIELSGITPALILGTAGTIGTISVLVLPETRGKPLPSNVKDMTSQQSKCCPCLEKKEQNPDDDGDEVL